MSELLEEPQVLGGAVDVPVDKAQECLASLTPGPAPTAPLGEWLALIAAREGQAMHKLHGAMARRLHGTVSRIVSDPHLVDEVVGECFWQVWREASRFDVTRGSVATWMTTIARSRALDAMRRRKALARHEEALTDEHEQAGTPDHDSPHGRLESLQRERGLNDALARLDPMQRQMVSMSFIGGLSHEQVAEHCGMALGTVKSHIRRGLTQLRAHCVRAGLQP